MIDIRMLARERARAAAEKYELAVAYRDLREEQAKREQLALLVSRLVGAADCFADDPVPFDTFIRVDGQMAAEIDGLHFTMDGPRSDRYLRVVMPFCERCGHVRYSFPIRDLEALGMWLDNQDTQHQCPDDWEDWLINQEVREAEIDARAQARAAAESKTSRLEKLLAEHPLPWFEDALCNIAEGMLALASIKIQEVSDRG